MSASRIQLKKSAIGATSVTLIPSTMNRDDQNAAQVSSVVVNTPPAAPAPSPALDMLEQITRAPAHAAERAAETLRESLTTDLARAAACGARLEALRTQHMPELDRLARLNFGQLHALLGAGSSLAMQLRHAVQEVRTVFEGRGDDEVRVPSVLESLARMPARVARLTAKDVHACPTPPPACGCPAGTIKATIENAEVSPTVIPAQMAAVADLTSRLRHALGARGIDGLEAGVAVQIAPRGDPRGSTQAETTFSAEEAPHAD